MRFSKQEKRTKLIKEMVLELKEKKRRSARIRMPRSAGGATDDDADPIASLIIKKPKKSRCKTRTKTRKPKYLSLRLQFSTAERSPESSEMLSSTLSATTSCTASDKNSGSKLQLDLFPLHPENPVEEKEAHDENNMAYLFSVADGGASTLTGLLESAINTNTSSSDRGDNNKNNNNDSSGTTTLSPSSASLTYTYARGRREDQEEVALVRTALRNKEREPSEERWVRYSEVVERRRDDQEVSSCAAPDVRWRDQRLSLKLDYEEILSAWSDKGSLFIHAYPSPAPPPQSPQTVPDIHDDFLASQIPNGMIGQRHGWGNDGGCSWRVPEFTVSPGNDQRAGLHLVKVKKEEQEEQGVAVAPAAGGGEDQWKMGQREASVKRYKEKRQNRLFCKRIRYQVRKINAEKRPRLKGRFVKRS